MKSNFLYMIKNWCTWDRKSLFYLSIRVFALVCQPILFAYVPKAIIDCINSNANIYEIIKVVASFSVLIAITTWLAPFSKELLDGSSRIIRMRYAVLAFKKILYTHYINIESFSGRNAYMRASDFYKSNNSSAGIFSELCTQCAVSIIGIISSICLIYQVDFLIILTIFITCIIEFSLLKYLNQKNTEILNLRSNLFSKLDYFYFLSKNSSSSKDLLIYNFKEFFVHCCLKIIFEFQKLTNDYSQQSAQISGTRAITNFIRNLVAYAYLTYLVYTNKITISEYIFYFGVITGFSNWIMQLVKCYSDIQRCCNDCFYYREFIAEKKEMEFSNSELCKKIECIEFKNVCFKYPDNDKETINNVSFKINYGENIAIVGENGAGKTTIIKLLCGLYKPTSGQILINNIPTNTISTSSYFNLFSVVFQDYKFLPFSIAQNLCSSSQYNKKDLEKALKLSGIYEKINSLPEKENSLMVPEINENAVAFSGGEEQKLLLSKAIYKNAPILILDEPTAALDPIAENELYLKYSNISEQKTSFFISHRLSSTRFCNKILFVKNGTITESGTHVELMDLKKDYFKMYQLQSYYYKESAGGNS